MELKFIAPISKYLRVRIPIDTDYEWGDGWTNKQAKCFENEVYSAFEQAGYFIKPSSIDSGSPILTKKGVGEELSLYMHPMDFSGFATKEQIDEIVEILQHCKSVYAVGKVDTQEVYDISADEYEKILAENSPAILEWMREYKKTNENDYWVGMDFAENFRPQMVCFSSGGCFISDDVDCRFIENLKTIAEKNGLI